MEITITLQAEIKSILALKAKEGATYKDIKDEYLLLIGKELRFNSSKEFNDFMRTMSDVRRGKNNEGRLVWFTKSEKSKHIAKMVVNQKHPREQCTPRGTPLTKKVFHKSTSSCYYNDNNLYKKQRKYKSDSNLSENKIYGNAAFFCDYELIGDDFFLNIVNLDLKQPLNYVQPGRKGRPIKKCGHCVSGQFIKDVTKLMKSNIKFENHIILNIGSVDLLHGHDLSDLKRDFIDLYKEFERRRIQPVITTLAPLANMWFSKDMQMKWSIFNEFLKNNFPNVLDLSCCFMTNTKRVLFDCYQPSPKYVTGSNQAHSLWNFVGRQRVLKYLKEGVTELTYSNSIFRNNFVIL